VDNNPRNDVFWRSINTPSTEEATMDFVCRTLTDYGRKQSWLLNEDTVVAMTRYQFVAYNSKNNVYEVNHCLYGNQPSSFVGWEFYDLQDAIDLMDVEANSLTTNLVRLGFKPKENLNHLITTSKGAEIKVKFINDDTLSVKVNGAYKDLGWELSFSDKDGHYLSTRSEVYHLVNFLLSLEWDANTLFLLSHITTFRLGDTKFTVSETTLTLWRFMPVIKALESHFVHIPQDRDMWVGLSTILELECKLKYLLE
jgi:hypothetical protein